MGQDADAIRHDIELTRERMSEKADALAYKADVPARTKDKVREKKEGLLSAVTGKVQDAKEAVVGVKETVSESVVGAKDTVTSSVSDAKDTVTSSVSGAKDSVAGAAPDRDQLAGQAKRAKGMAETNPLGLAVGSMAIGFLAGLLVPSTNIENERLGPAADSLKAKAKDLGQEALDHGKQVATEVAQAAKETAQEAGQEHASELKDSATETAGSAQEDVSSAWSDNRSSNL